MQLRQPMSENQETRLKRLRYRSWHRGCKETDLILGNYIDAHMDTMNLAEIERFEAFLEEDDDAIWKWLTGKLEPKDEYKPLIDILRHFREFSES